MDPYERLEQKIGACFGTADCEFAGHPADEQEARGLRDWVRTHDLDRERVRGIIGNYLQDKARPELARAETAKAMAFFFKAR